MILKKKELQLPSISRKRKYQLPSINRKKKYQLPNINRKKKYHLLWGIGQKSKGQVHTVFGFFVLELVAIMAIAGLWMEQNLIASMELEDALACSNLAASQIDIKRYGTDHTILIANPVEARSQFEKALAENLDLSPDTFIPQNAMAVGGLVVEEFCVINVEGQQVTCIWVKDDGSVKEIMGVLGTATTPNGLLIRQTGIYSSASYYRSGFLNRGAPVLVKKQVLTGVVQK